MIPPLCIIQARLKSTRLPNKMLLKLGGTTLIEHAWFTASLAFGEDHCVVAIPGGDMQGPLGDHLRNIGARIFAADFPEVDVLGRFHACAHTYRWRPESVIVRWTPDDPFKDPEMVKRVVAGERLPVELGAEAFTLAMLDAADSEHLLFFSDMPGSPREHITKALFRFPPPAAPDGVWTIDTQSDYEAACAVVERALPKRDDASGSTRPRAVRKGA